MSASAGSSVPGAKMSQHSCPLCSFTSTHQGALESHMSSHLRSKPQHFTCRICGYNTVCHSGMAEHMEMHKTRRPGRGRQRSRSFCLLCEYSAADRLQLEYHMFSHAEKLGDLLLCRDGEVTHGSNTAEQLVSGQTSEGLATDVNSANRTVQKVHPRGTLWCGECGYTTRLKTDLSKHLKTHQKKFVCDVCGFQSWNELALQAHKGDRMLECEKCGYSVSCKAEMRKHAKTHHAEKTVHRCEKCSFQTAWKSVLDSHVKIHTDEKPFTCGQCDYKSAFKESLTGHLKNNMSEKSLQCKDCSYRTTCRRAMRVHLKNHVYTCKKCNAILNSKDNLEKHMRDHQKEEKEQALICEVCSYRAFSRTSLDIHMRKHTGEKPFACGECSYRAKSKTTLRMHVASKHKKTFRCLECGFGTNVEDKMDEHVKVHAKYFTCGDCDFVAASREEIDAHMDTHAGAQGTIMCGKCRQYFTTNGAKMGAHMQNHL